jgi:16S rRNA (uracil1498-N3)-methyltransferase
VPARRFFVEGVRAAGDTVAIRGGDAHKIAHVLRLREGDRIEVVDSAGTLFSAAIGNADATRVAVTLHQSEEPAQTREASVQIDLAQALPKGSKMDFIVEKATELGVAAIVPFTSERTVVHDVGNAKLERWRRLAKSAAQQCGRRSVPQVSGVVTFDDLLDRFNDYDATLFPWELAPHVPLRQSLPPIFENAERMLIVVGPEGGFSHVEAQAAVDRGAHLLWLGRRILRTESAAMALLAVIDALTQ